MTNRVLPTPLITEKEFTAQIIELAHIYGWRVLHLRPARSQSGRWATHIQGDGVGWPDLFMARNERAVAAELKVGRNKTTVAQEVWLDRLAGVAGVESHVWRPDDWDQIVSVLR